MTFVNLSPASDSLAVIQSSEAKGKTVNGVAVLDVHGLVPRAQWHDDAESWNIAVSAESAVRTQGEGTRLQMIDLGKASDANTDWNTVWSSVTSSARRPVFLGANRFAFATGNSVVLFSAPNGSDRKDVDCSNALGVRASRDGGLLAAACVRDVVQTGSVVAANSIEGMVSGASVKTIEVYQATPFRKLGSVTLEETPGAGFDFALSPSAAKVAVVDQLRLKVYTVSSKAGEPTTVAHAEAAEAQATDVRAPNAETPIVQSTTRLVLVDAVVTDSHSHPLAAIEASNFTILENGKPQKVSFFSYESPASKVNSVPPPLLQAGSVTNRPDPRQAAPIVILLLDGLNTPSSQQLYVRQEMLKYLRDLKPSNARMAVLALASNLAVLQDFTTDLSTLQAALKDYKRGRTRGDVDTAPIDLAAASGGAFAAPTGSNVGQSGGSLPGVQELLDFFSRTVANDEQDVRIRTTIAALQAIAQSVVGYPGRKSLVWMSSSFPFTLSFQSPISFQSNPISPFSFYKEYGDDIRKTTALLTDANVAVYPIDAHGLISGGGIADVSSAATSGAPGTDLSKEVFTNFRSDETLNTVAAETGGRAFRNTNDLKDAIKTAIEESSSYYVLGYYLDQKNLDGKFHTIRVKVARDGAHVRSRTGYFALDVNDWRKQKDEKSTAFGLAELAATGVLLEARPIQPKQGQPATVEILVDTSTISFGSGPGVTYSVDLSFEVAALKADGKPEHVETRTVIGDLKETTYQQFLRTGMPMRVDMPLPPGRHLLRIKVRDNWTGHLGSLDLPVSMN
jgi:VWFA-related protein